MDVKPSVEYREAGDAVTRLHALESSPDQPIDVRRYVNALRRSRFLIGLIVATLTGIVLAVSLVLPKTYSARATILLDESPDLVASADVARRLATIQTLLGTRDVLARAARRLEGESTDTLAGKVHASVDPNANIISVGATDTSPKGAADIANAVTTSFLAKQRNFELRRLQGARAKLLQAISRLGGSPGARSEIALIRERLSELSVSEASAGSELQLADPARPSTGPASPRPFRSAMFAFFAALFIAALVALARERILPRISGPRELSRLSGLPILTALPHRSSRFRRGGALDPVDRESFEALSAVVGSRLPPGRQRTLLVTSAFEDEAKAEVTGGLGRALARAGEATLIIDADMRRHALEDLFGMEQTPGLAEILAAAQRDGEGAAADILAEPPTPAAGRGAGSIAILGSGHGPSNPALLSSAEALDVFFGELHGSGYTYVLINGPLLGFVDCQHWAQRVDGVLVVSRPDRLVPSDVVEMRELLERLDANALGHVVVGNGTSSL